MSNPVSLKYAVMLKISFGPFCEPSAGSVIDNSVAPRIVNIISLNPAAVPLFHNIWIRNCPYCVALSDISQSAIEISEPELAMSLVEE